MFSITELKMNMLNWITQILHFKKNKAANEKPQKDLSHIPEEDKKERKRLYETYREHNLKSQLSNSENFDKEILTLSSAFLGASLTFIKNVVPLTTAWYLWQLVASYIFFLLAIIITISSFLISQKALKLQLEHAEKYYLEFRNAYLKRKNCWASCTEYLSYYAALFFILGIIFIALFIILNLTKR